MAKRNLTVKDIIAFIEKEGGREMTEADKKTDLYKFAFKKPSCFKSKATHKTAKA